MPYMDAAILKKVKQVLDKSSCPNGCKCYRIQPKEMCKARSMGINNLLECLEDEPGECSFSMAFGGSYFCKCQTRIELAKILGE